MNTTLEIPLFTTFQLLWIRPKNKSHNFSWNNGPLMILQKINLYFFSPTHAHTHAHPYMHTNTNINSPPTQRDLSKSLPHLHRWWHSSAHLILPKIQAANQCVCFIKSALYFVPSGWLLRLHRRNSPQQDAGVGLSAAAGCSVKICRRLLGRGGDLWSRPQHSVLGNFSNVPFHLVLLLLLLLNNSPRWGSRDRARAIGGERAWFTGHGRACLSCHIS